MTADVDNTRPGVSTGVDAAVPDSGKHGDRRDSVIGRVDGPVTGRGVIASEWLKFRSLRSTLLVLTAAVVGMVAFGAIIAFNTRNPPVRTRRTSSHPGHSRATTSASC